MEFLFKLYDFFSTFLLEIWSYEFGAVLVEVTLWLYVPNTISVKKIEQLNDWKANFR